MKYDSVIIGLAYDGFYFTFENKEDPNNQEQFFISQEIDGTVDDLQSMFECIGFKNINVEEVC